MQTPASMEKNNILIFILLILIINRFFAQICINMFYAFSFLLYIFLFIKDGNNLNLNKESLFKLVKEYETDSKFNFKLNFESFKELSNGIFQAEGHIGGYFVSKKNNKFRLLIYIGLTVNIESILFFVYLNKEFEYKMNYSIEKLPSDKFYIKLYSRDWKLIIDKIIPYFNNVYGDKYKGLKRLEKIYYLQSEYNNKEKNDEKIILLAYHLVDNSKRKLLIKDRFSLFKISPTLDVNFFLFQKIINL